MTERLVNETNGAAENADARAPLSSYLRDGPLTESQDGWTVILSDDGSDSRRTPNLSVLKQIKNFLNAKSGESNVPFDSGARRFRVDYPYYAPDSENESSTSNIDESAPSASFIPAMSSDNAAPKFAEVEQESTPLGKIVTVSDNRPETVDIIPTPIPYEGDESESTPKVQAARKNSEDRIEAFASSTTDSLGRKENGVLVCSLVPQEETNETSFQESTTQTPTLLDVAEFSEISFSDAEEPTVYSRVEEENKSPETVEEKQSVSSAELMSTRNLQRIDSFEKPREKESSVVDSAPKTAAQRRYSNGRLSIFRRFVDLVTTRNGTDSDDQNLSREESVGALTQDYSHEICICNAYEPVSSMEVVVAPCYVGANMTLQSR